MSWENVEIVRRVAAAINAREVPVDLLAPDFRMKNVSTAVTDRTYEGADGFRQWIADFFDVLEDDARHETEPISVGDDYVACKFRIVGRGLASRAPVDMRWYGVVWFRDGKVAHVVGYAKRREALDAVGLSE